MHLHVLKRTTRAPKRRSQAGSNMPGWRAGQDLESAAGGGCETGGQPCHAQAASNTGGPLFTCQHCTLLT